MNKNSIKNISSSSSLTLSWSDDKISAEIDKTIKQTLSTFPVEDNVDITFTLDSPDVAFEENKSQQWNGTTGFYGNINVNIYSITKTPCDFKLIAYCSDSPEISAKPLLLKFLPKEVNNIKLVVNKDNAQANGTDTDELIATVQDDEGHPIKGVTVDFTADNGARVSPSSGQTDEKGEIAITVTSESGGEVRVQATVAQNGKMTTALVQFKEDYSIELIPKKNNAKANGIDTDELTATVKDYGGHPIKGVTVDFTADNGVWVSPSSGQTDEKGEIAITVTSESGGEFKVWAIVLQYSKMTTALVQFKEDYSIELISKKNNAKANGIDTDELTATVKDYGGHPIKGVTVDFTADNGVWVSPSSGQTDEKGEIAITVTSESGGEFKVWAIVLQYSKMTTALVQFKEDYSIELISKKNNAKANGIDTDELTATVKDYGGHPIKGVTVDFTADNGARVSPSSDQTDEKGEIAITVTSDIAGPAKVQAKIQQSGKKDVTTIQFEICYKYFIKISNFPDSIKYEEPPKIIEGYLYANPGVINPDVYNKEIKIITGEGFHSTDHNNSVITNKEGYFKFTIEAENRIICYNCSIENITSSFTLSCIDSKDIKSSINATVQKVHRWPGGMPPQ
ncbi:Ig-like domain-containing protein [Xenorhabdus bovienii]|uniref:Ig-like domain-containing protein n=2 Tax=Xenorhabdus bovienii TaxID=40576 RepID=UPI0023B261A0|nr:Ig-like domain-containing protein [Xenorhabdus bovienii]MDE9468177.1 Ig-like domain-containing protein [Xenorhabdus bovienii]